MKAYLSGNRAVDLVRPSDERAPHVEHLEALDHGDAGGLGSRFPRGRAALLHALGVSGVLTVFAALALERRVNLWRPDLLATF